MLLGVVDRPARRVEDFLAAHHQLALEVQVGGGDEDVNARVLGLLDALDRLLDVGLARPRQAEDDGLGHRLRDAGHRIEVTRRRHGEARLDDVDVELLQLARDEHLLLDVHRRAGRLLAVAQRRVEDPYRLLIQLSSDTSLSGRRRCGGAQCKKGRGGKLPVALLETQTPRAACPPVAPSVAYDRPYAPPDAPGGLRSSSSSRRDAPCTYREANMMGEACKRRHRSCQERSRRRCRRPWSGSGRGPGAAGVSPGCSTAVGGRGRRDICARSRLPRTHDPAKRTGARVQREPHEEHDLRLGNHQHQQHDARQEDPEGLAAIELGFLEAEELQVAHHQPGERVGDEQEDGVLVTSDPRHRSGSRAGRSSRSPRRPRESAGR